jgi:uncharacterized protein YkwD
VRKLTRGLFLLTGLLSLFCSGHEDRQNLVPPAGSARGLRLLRLAIPDMTAPLSETYPAPSHPEDSVEKAVFERINRDRVEAGLSPVAWDGASASVARAFCAQQVRERTNGHFLMDGLAPYARTGFAGVFGLQSENSVSWVSTASGFDEPPSSLALEGHVQMLAERPPNDGHRRTILDPHATHVGVGWALEKGSFRMAQEFLTRDLAQLTLERGPTRPLSISVRGAILAPRRLQFVTFCWEPLPRPLSREEANRVRNYSYPLAARAFVPEGDTRSYIVGAATEPRLRLQPERGFSFRFVPEKAGLWTMIFHTAAKASERARPGGSATLQVEEEKE